MKPEPTSNRLLAASERFGTMIRFLAELLPVLPLAILLAVEAWVSTRS